MRITFTLNLQAIRLLRRQLMLLLASCTSHASLIMALYAQEDTNNYSYGITTFVVMLQTYQLELSFLNERYVEQFQVSSKSAVTSVYLKLLEPTDFLKFLTKDFKESEKNISFEVKRRADKYYLEYSGEISGSKVSGKFPLDFQPEQVENLISASGFNQEVKLQLTLPRVVSTLESMHISKIDLELMIDLNSKSVDKIINFVGRSHNYKIRLEQRLENYECDKADYLFETRIPWQILDRLMLPMKEFKQAELYVDERRRLLLHMKDESEDSKYLRLYLQADLKVKQEEPAMNQQESNHNVSASLE